ncbi:MAG: type II secretion system F family protein [Ectothiorhodospiraceae bacterium]|nr:type II secretion system F family protein [Chromatiales bacterium]MCP5155329.1 type II secretion system F family protein [Ectothiorhodospiraceae bacterium]
MPRYRYKAASAAGEVVGGQMDAPDREVVVRLLQGQGHVPIRVDEVAGTATGGGRRLFAPRRIRAADLGMFTVEMSTLLGAGLAVDRALEALRDLAQPGPLRSLIERLLTAVRSGQDLSAAMEAAPETFSRFYRSIVRAGEASGALEPALQGLAEFLERARALREATSQALVYPVILVFVAILCLAVILGVVVPRVEVMFADARVELPLATQVVVAVGDVIERWWWVIALLGIALWVGARRLLAREPVRLRFDEAVLRLPVIGDLVSKVEAARFTRTLGTLLRNGVPLLTAIRIAKDVIGNLFVRAAVEGIATSVREGEGVARPLAEAEVFPRLAAHLVEVGERSGNLEGMLLRLADIYDGEVEVAVRRATSLLGPVLILGLGVLIAGIILSVLAAVLRVNELAF